MCLKKFVLPDPVMGTKIGLRVADVGSAGDGENYRMLFDLLDCDHTRIDIAAGTDVALTSENQNVLPFSDDEFDIVFSGHTFQRTEFFWKTFSEMCRITNAGGLIIVISPSGGPAHTHPVDCYRFMPDAMAALAVHAGVVLVDSWTSDFGPFNDAVGVFRKTGPGKIVDSFPPDLSLRLAQPVQNSFPDNVPEEVEHGAGTEDCYDFLVRVHQLVKPRFYTEIGVEYGNSLRLADCPALGIDPAPQLTEALDSRHRVSMTTSDDFFMLTDAASQLQPIDLSYVDGMHQIEFALKDFMHMEKYCHAGSVVIIDDVYPAHALQGERVRQSRFWTGDVWKIIFILERVRPDLILLPLDTSPTGSLLVLGLDPMNQELWNQFDDIIEEAINSMTETPHEIVRREKKFDPRDPLISRILSMVHEGREGAEMVDVLARIRALIAGSLPRVVVQ